MKNILTIAIIIFLLCNTSIITSVSNDDMESKNTVFTVTISDTEIKNNGLFVELYLPESTTYTTRPGSPRLPTIEKTLTFPQHTKILKITPTITGSTKQHLTQNIILNPIPVQINTSTNLSQYNNSFYEHPTPYPNTWINYDVGNGLYNGKRSIILNIQINPIQYYPSENLIINAHEIQITIQYTTTQTMKSTSSIFDENYKLLILTPSEFKTNLEPLRTHKENRNISTKLVTIDEITQGTYFEPQGLDLQEQIKYFIKNAYDQWETQFVLLVGGKEYFPSRKSHVYIGDHNDNEIFVSDLYYADLYDENYSFQTWDSNGNGLYAEYNWSGAYDQLDLYPDVYIGRLACVNSEEVDVVVDKIIAYEESQAFKKSWFKDIVLIGGDSFPSIYGDESGVNEGELANQRVLEVMDGFRGIKLWVSNGKLAGINPTGVGRIMESINQGCGFVHFSGHGSSSLWTTYSHNGTRQNIPSPTGNYRTDHIMSLQNGYFLPIVVTGACSVGQYQNNDRCFSWSFISNPYGGGIASFGATGLGYACLGTNVTDYVIEKMALEMFKAYNIYEARTVGEMWATAITHYITPLLFDTDYKTIEEWQPFCDPSLALQEEYLPPSQPPFPPILQGPQTIKPDVLTTYTVITTDPDRNDVYYLFDWGDESVTDWIGPIDSGVTINASHSWEEKREYSIRVKAKDEQGYESSWSEPFMISVEKHHSISQSLLYWFINQFRELLPLLKNLQSNII